MLKNLICLENNKVSVIRLRNDKLEFVRRDGEIEFPITIDFWDWWKRAVSYIEQDEADVCFVYDKQYDMLENINIINVINTEQSEWKIDYIKSYFWKLKPTYLNVIVIGKQKQEYSLSGNGGVNSRRFYTNLDFKVPKQYKKSSGDPKEETAAIINEDDYSPFAKYFVDLIRNERGR